MNWYEIGGWLLVLAGMIVLGWFLPLSKHEKRLNDLRVEARGLVAIHGAGLIYGPWVTERLSDFPEGRWRERAKRALCHEFRSEMQRLGVWEDHVLLCIALGRVIGE